LLSQAVQPQLSVLYHVVLLQRLSQMCEPEL